MSDILPPIEDLTQDEANRLICADYLRAIARLIEKGAVSAFDLSWAAKVASKPVGRFVTDASFLMCAAEAELTLKVEEYKTQQAKKIEVEDFSGKLKVTSSDN